jgi:hypothetical protein
LSTKWDCLSKRITDEEIKNFPLPWFAFYFLTDNAVDTSSFQRAYQLKNPNIQFFFEKSGNRYVPEEPLYGHTHIGHLFLYTDNQLVVLEEGRAVCRSI